MDVIVGMIHRRAVESFSQPLLQANYNEWINHWFQEAEKLKAEFELVGLEKSAAFVQEWIDFNRDLIRDRNPQPKEMVS